MHLSVSTRGCSCRWDAQLVEAEVEPRSQRLSALASVLSVLGVAMAIRHDGKLIVDPGQVQELVENEAGEEAELRAFRYHMRCALAGPLLTARAAAAAAAPGAAVDFLALAQLVAGARVTLKRIKRICCEGHLGTRFHDRTRSCASGWGRLGGHTLSGC